MSQILTAQRAKPLNFAICLTDAFTWSFSMALFSLTTIVPLFLRQLHASNFVIGLLPAIVSFGYFVPGLLVSRRIGRLTRAKWWLFTIAVLERLPLLVIALVTPMLGPKHPLTVLCLFLGGFAVHAVCLGFNQPAYWVVVSKIIPIRQRGRVFGWAGVVGGLTGFLIDPITRHYLTPVGMASLRGFTDCFLIGTIATYLGILGFAFADEPAQVAVPDETAVKEQHFLRDASVLWRSNQALRRLIYGQAMISMASMAQPFFVLAYSSRFHVGRGAIADFTTIGAVLGSLGSLGWGAWGDHRGNKGVLILSQAFGFVSLALAFFSPPAAFFYLIFTASALSATGIGIASYNIMMEFAGESGVSFYTAFYNGILAPFRIVAPLIGGYIADRAGYPCVFGLSALFAAVSVVFAVRMVEPRKTPATQ